MSVWRVLGILSLHLAFGNFILDELQVLDEKKIKKGERKLGKH